MTSPINNAANPLADVVNSLIRKYDSSGDARLSSDEFAAFLNDMLGPGSARTNSTFAPGTAARTASDGPVLGRLEGFDATKLANPSHQTMKYQVGRILQQYPNTPQGLQDALPSIQALVPGARITGSSGDKLDFGSYTDNHGHRLGIIDILRSASTGGSAWQWIPVE